MAPHPTGPAGATGASSSSSLQQLAGLLGNNQTQADIDPWGLGSWSATGDSGLTSTWYWLRDGNTDAYNRSQYVYRGSKVYYGNEADGFHEVKLSDNPRLRRVGGQRFATRPVHGAQTVGKDATLKSANDTADAFSHLSKKNPMRFAQVQDLMRKAGMYGSTVPTYGSYDIGLDGKAWASAVASAHAAGMSVQDWLQKKADQNDAQGVNSFHRAPLVVHYTDPMAIRASVTATAPKTIGRTLNETEMQQYVNQIHAGEAASQQADYNAGQTGVDTNGNPVYGKGGSVTDVSGSEGAAAEYEKAQHPAEYQATQMGENATAIYNQLFQHLPGGPQ